MSGMRGTALRRGGPRIGVDSALLRRNPTICASSVAGVRPTPPLAAHTLGSPFVGPWRKRVIHSLLQWLGAVLVLVTLWTRFDPVCDLSLPDHRASGPDGYPRAHDMVKCSTNGRT
jgi:hypothetical protein